VTYLIDVPVNAGGRLLVEASGDDLPGQLELAALRPGEIAARARESLEQALDQVKPAIEVVLGQLRSMSPDEVAVEFGIVLGAEAGVVIAKGRADVHFSVSLTWRKPARSATSTVDSQSEGEAPMEPDRA
jgi:hypothetical protein